MSPYLPPELVQDQLRADLDVIDAAHTRVRAISTALVGQAFRVELAARLEAQERFNRALMLRTFAELADPPDGIEDPALPAGVKLRDMLSTRLRITTGQVRARMRIAARIRPRRTLTGAPTPPELPVLADAVARGVLGEDHIREVCRALDALPKAVSAADRDTVEKILVTHAEQYDAGFVAELGRALADRLNPDGDFDDTDRQNRRGLVLGRQGPDGMSKLSGWLTPKARSFLEAISAAVRPGHHLPEQEQTVVDAATDTRTGSQRCHDALAWGLETALSSGRLGTHRGLPVTVIATTTLAELEQAAAAVTDPGVPMPPPARTGGGSSLPMRDLIAMAARSIQYLAVFDDHSARPLYLGRAKRLATSDQRIICYARDRGCTHCAAPGYHCEVHHGVDYANGGPTDADNLFFACGPSNQGVADGHYSTEVTDTGRLAWTDGTRPPQVNPRHHPEELLAEDEDDP